SVTPDGRYIIFTSERTGRFDIWKMNIDGSDQVKLIQGINPQISPDGRWLVYQNRGMWRVSLDGGAPVRVTDLLVSQHSVSPDGKLIAFRYSKASDSGRGLAVIPSEGGRVIKMLQG